MQSRLLKWWSKPSVSRALGILALGVIPASSIVHATVQITPVNAGSFNNGVAYYASSVSQGGSVTFMMDQGFSAFDLTQSQTSEASTNRPNLLLFDVFSDQTFSTTVGSASKSLVVTVTTVLSNNATATFNVPIAAAYSPGTASKDCVNGDNCQGAVVNGHLFAARYAPQSMLRIGIYPRDICADVNAQAAGSAAQGCNVNTVALPATGSSGSITTMKLTFNVSQVSDSVNMPGASDTKDTVPATATLSFQSDSPTLSCPANLPGVYFPGDGEIQLDAAQFGATVLPGRAPAIAVLILGSDGSAPDTSIAGFLTHNSLVARASIAQGRQSVGGFLNTTNGNDHVYQVAFTIRDGAGILAPFAGCNLTSVQTSTIQGFLKKSNCFIATAAFRSIDAPPVVLLREFRDEILLNSTPGRIFVHWYYRWSPPAAQWLIEHPSFRFPVLLFLIPMEGLAWLALHPLFFFLFLAGTLGVVLIMLGAPRMGRKKC